MFFIKFIVVILITCFGFAAGAEYAKHVANLQEVEGATLGAGIGLIAGILIVSLWRVLLALAAVGIVIFVVGTVAYTPEAKQWWEELFGGGRDHYQRQTSSTEAIIRAVHDHLDGKTYKDYQTEYVPKWMPCTQLDYDADPAKGDPNLGTCRDYNRYGYGHYGRKKVDRSVHRPIERNCPQPPPVSSAQWQVAALGSDRWTVSYANGRWIVEKIGSTFRVVPQQDC